MSSYLQVIIGGMLLVTAFLFGRHINNKPILPKPRVSDGGNSESLVRQKTDAPLVNDESNAQKSLQKTLRERILGERQIARSPQGQEFPTVNQTAGSEPENSPFKLPDQEVVVPDFSNLEFAAEPGKPSVVEAQTGNNFPSQKLPIKKSSNSNSQNGKVVVGPIPKPKTADHNKSSPRKPLRNPVASKPKTITKRGQLKIGDRSDYLVPIRRQSKSQASARQFVTHKTVFGDTLHSLSNHFFGKPDYYLDIYLANRDRLQNPSDVPVNTTLRIPVVAKLIKKPSGNP